MPKMIDLTGKVFGRLTVMHRGENYKLKTTWVCKCECGNEKTVNYQNLIVGTSTSCGCFHKELLSKRVTVHGNAKKGKITSEFSIWSGMKDRCENKNSTRYSDYGGRGIAVCKRWSESFENFLLDMGKRPSNKHSLDRKENNGDYSPVNCRWATIAEQSRNKRTNVWVEYKGQKKIVTDVAKDLGVIPQYFRTLLTYKTLEEAIKHVQLKKVS